MSLRVWLPLNGDLHNQGLSSYNISMLRGSAIFDNNGKIGKCFHANGVNTIKIENIIPDFYNYSGYSLCAWFYIESQNTSHSGSGIISAGNWNNQILNLALSDWSTDHYTRLQVSGTSWNKIYNYTFNKNTWYHVVVSSDGNKTYAYVNGVLIGNTVVGFLPTSIEGNNIAIGGATYYSGMQFFGKINDVRIYDHALSVKEIEEIAKGLVLHYKLDDTYSESTTNLCNNLKNGGRTVLSTNPLMITTTGENADTYWYVKTSSALVGGNTYTLSLRCSGLAPGEYFQFGIGAQSGANNCGNFAIYNGYNEKTFTLASGLNGVTQFILDDNSYSSGVRSKRISFYNVQLEAKDHATGYAGVGGSRVATTIYDSSGYNNNGTIVGSLKTATPSSRYSCATKFNGSAYIKHTPFNFSTGDWTVSFWYYRTAQPSAYEGFLCLSKGNGADANKKFAAMPNNGYIWFKCESGSRTLSSLKTNTWTHIVITSEGKIYEDGVSKLSLTPGTILTDCTDLVIGARASATGVTSVTTLLNNSNLSDVRIYATALTPAQIKELYNTSMSIDNNGNIHTRELVEL